MMWLCGLGFHKWGKWIDKTLRTRPTIYGIPTAEWHDIQGQRRECKRCGVSELRTN